jgi:antirestriction protein ArdC
MRIDTGQTAFDMQQIENRRFMYQPQTGTLILGYQYKGNHLASSHADEHFKSGAAEPFDSFIRGWIGSGKSYPHGIIHFAPNIPADNVQAFDRAYSTLQMFRDNGAAGNTVIRGFGASWEQPLNQIIIERSNQMDEQNTNTALPVNPIMLSGENSADRLKEITDRLEQGIKELFESERYKEYLRVMSKFYNYSFNNTLLIAMQKPDASLVAGFTAWKNNFKRNVIKGEKGIRILAPAPFKVKREMEKLDPQTQQPIIGKDGKPVTEEQEVTIPAFKVVSVFDVSQTEGKELPNIGVDELTGDVEQYKDFFAALERTSPVPIGFEKIESGAHGYYHLEEKRIAIDEGMSELQTLKTAIHEVSHAKLHDIDLNAPKDEQQVRPDRRTREVEAESVAYTVCQHYGLDTSDYSFGYVAGWSSGKELTELKGSLETIRSAANEIINSIDEHLKEIQQEREAAQEKEILPPSLDPAVQPVVTVLWSESDKLQEGEKLSLARADTLFANLDEAHKDIPGYDKTKFRIDFTMNGEPDYYEGRQDFGDGDGGLIAHIEKYHAYYQNNDDWDSFLLHSQGKEALDADKAQRDMLLNEFIPYLKLHCNLSAQEKEASGVLEGGEALTPGQTEYFEAVLAHVDVCREKLNNGEYQLPDPPQLSDYLHEAEELETYKAHVREEIAQEAAAAGMTVEEYAANGYEPKTDGQEQDTFTIYQLKRGDETRDLRFEPLDRLTAAGYSVDKANYDLIYSAPLTPDMTLGRIWEVFNTDHPKDFKGHSLSISDVVVLHQNGQDTAHYVDSYGYMEIPQFLQEQQKVLSPDKQMTGEMIKTPRGSFHVTSMSREQMEAAGYGMHHSSEDGKYIIMGNGTQAYAVAAMQPENYLKSAELSTEQNSNMIDGVINNTPTADELEQKMKSGEPVSLSEYAAALKNEKQKKPEREEKPSIRAQLQAYKEQNAKAKRTRSRSQDLERD